jgi:tricorn protease
MLYMTSTKLLSRAGILLLSFFLQVSLHAQGTRLLRQPSLSDRNIAFVYGADIWVVDKKGGEARRITSTAAIESDPHFSPDGLSIAFTSNRSGVAAVYVVSVEGGTPTRLTWYPSAAYARGWTPDGKYILYSSTRETAPTRYGRLWTVPVNGGPSTLLPSPFGFDGSFAADGKRMVVDRVSRWDGEWRSYRGGQNTALQILDLHSLAEKSIPSERTYDFQPVWLGNLIYFLSDRDDCMNIWSFDPDNDKLSQITNVKHTDIKWLDGNQKELVYEWKGYLFLLDRVTNKSEQLTINVTGDFPWAETHWEDVTSKAQNVSLSPTGKRIVLEARGEIFTAPVENGDARNITQSSDAADRQPLWSPDGRQIAWFSDAGGKGYALHLASQDGSNSMKIIPIGESKLGWEPVWSPDNKYIAFVDNKVRIQVITLATGKLITADTGGSNIERGRMGLTWSPDSKWLAYSRTALNNFRRVSIWSLETNEKTPLTDPMADAFSPAWDRDGRHLYFLASTSIALGSGWANTSAILAKPTFGGYIAVLRKDDPSPFPLKSDEEPDSTADSKKAKDTTAGVKVVKIDFAGIDRRIVALPIPQGNYDYMLAGPKGTVFIGADDEVSKFTIETKKLEPFTKPASDVSVSANGEKILIGSGGKWRVVATAKTPSPDEGKVNMILKMELNRIGEWKQIFEEVWHYERDYFYDPNIHGRDWQAVWERYAPLVPYIRHRSDLTYVIDQVGGELSVGHSFVFGGDFPEVDKSNTGLLGADLLQNGKYWQIKRIYTTESWNPGLTAPLAEPDLKVKEGDFIISIDGKELGSDTDPYSLLVGKAGKQTILTVNGKPSAEGAWKIKVSPVDNEDGLRQRAWVEDNRRKVNELSKGRLGYVWVPNTGGPGFVSFNRYYFAQQDKEGAVIDERFNGGGSLDDYMVDLMIRKLRAAITNEVPGGAPFRLPAGILGPKVLLINEMAGSGGDFFPWAFRHQNVGPLIGTRTWGGLVKSSVHYSLIDGGAITAPDNAVFDPIQDKWIAENQGIAPDIEQKMDALSVSKGIDPQLERAVEEVLKLLQKEPTPAITHPPYSKPAKN